jgi:hypothetical protein
MIDVSPPDTGFGWWFEQQGCNPEDENSHQQCRCGRVTLLEVLDTLTPGDQQAAIEAHNSLQHAVWNHFWSADALVCGDEELGDVCADCFIEGGDHVVDLQTAAENLGVELAEAIAAHRLRIVFPDPEPPSEPETL